MRGYLPTVLLLAPVALATSAAADDHDVDAYVVTGVHAAFGSVSGYLQAQPSKLGQLWLTGPGLIYFHARFSFLCDTHVEAGLVAQKCAGSQKHFVGGYAVDDDGAATGTAFGYGDMYGFRLVAHAHT